MNSQELDAKLGVPMGALTRKDLRQIAKSRMRGMKIEAQAHARAQVQAFLRNQEGFEGWLRRNMSEE